MGGTSLASPGSGHPLHYVWNVRSEFVWGLGSQLLSRPIHCLVKSSSADAAPPQVRKAIQANRGEFSEEERKAQKEITLKVRQFRPRGRGGGRCGTASACAAHVEADGGGASGTSGPWGIPRGRMSFIGAHGKRGRAAVRCAHSGRCQASDPSADRQPLSAGRPGGPHEVRNLQELPHVQVGPPRFRVGEAATRLYRSGDRPAGLMSRSNQG